ncbi:hypothetical protein ACTXT7_016634 [Hymenolepis weldensis]
MVSYREEQIIRVFEAQLLDYANIEARISSIVRNTFIQTNFSTSTKDFEDYVNNVKFLLHGMPDSTFVPLGQGTGYQEVFLRTRNGLKMTDNLLTEATVSSSENHPTNIRNSHCHRDCSFKRCRYRNSVKMASAEIFYERFGEAGPEQ